MEWDWVNCLDMRCSIGGYAFSLQSDVVSWNARKQKTVVASSCEAEYIAGFEATKECIWLRALLRGIDIATTAPTTIPCDNNVAITLSEDPLLHAHVKHIDVKYHFLHEWVQSRDLVLTYVNTKDNVADIFTKPLDTRQFQHLQWLKRPFPCFLISI